jgi:hypothetical protein
VPSTSQPNQAGRQQGYVVQVASHVHREQAERAAARLHEDGWQHAGVLRSDTYPELRRGYWVTFVGPFQATAQGRQHAQQVQQQLPGSLVRLLGVRRPAGPAGPELGSS